jgi:hypothetical protein
MTPSSLSVRHLRSATAEKPFLKNGGPESGYPQRGVKYKPGFMPQVAGRERHIEVVEPPRRRGSAQAIGMTRASFRSRNRACSRSGCCMFRLPGVHCGFLMHVPDTGTRHLSQSVRQALALRSRG